MHNPNFFYLCKEKKSIVIPITYFIFKFTISKTNSEYSIVNQRSSGTFVSLPLDCKPSRFFEIYDNCVQSGKGNNIIQVGDFYLENLSSIFIKVSTSLISTKKLCYV